MIHMPGGAERRAAKNSRTLMSEGGGFWQQLRQVEVPFDKLFAANYETIRAAALGFGRVGVALVAVDIESRGLAGLVCLAARPGEPRLAIVGRHGLADLFLDDDASVSLRHLAVLLHGAQSWDPDRLALSLIDLRSGLRFDDEYGQRLEALEAAGSVFVRFGRYALFCLPTGDKLSWPARAKDAWAMIPAREYTRAQRADVEQDPRQRLWRQAPSVVRRAPGRVPAAPAGSGRTQITLMDGPEMAQSLWLGADERPIGHITVRSSHTARTMPVSERALLQGVIVGRDERCDQSDLLADPYISRVHLMLRVIDGRLWAMDLASTGRTFTWEQGHMVALRLAPVEGPRHLALAKGRASVDWHPV